MCFYQFYWFIRNNWYSKFVKKVDKKLGLHSRRGYEMNIRFNPTPDLLLEFNRPDRMSAELWKNKIGNNFRNNFPFFYISWSLLFDLSPSFRSFIFVLYNCLYLVFVKLGIWLFSIETLLRTVTFKGTVSVNFKWTSMQRCQCPIHNGALKSFVWAGMIWILKTDLHISTAELSELNTCELRKTTLFSIMNYCFINFIDVVIHTRIVGRSYSLILCDEPCI